MSATVALGFAGANVTTPHKLAVAKLVETSASSINTLDVRGDKVLGYSTDASTHENSIPTCGNGGGGCLRRSVARCSPFSRRESWPPSDITRVDLVINATSERDEDLMELKQGQTLIDLPSATARAAEVVGARVESTAPGAPSRKGLRPSTLWTGVPAPLDVMRAIRA